MEKVLAKKGWDELSPEEKRTRRRESANAASKAHRAWLKSLSPEALKEYRDNNRWRKEERARERARKEEEKKHKELIARELTILHYMKDLGLLYYHHSEADNLEKRIEEAIKMVNEGQVQEYNPYVWNHQGEGNNYMPICQFGKLWRHNQFETIYDVPLDGTWIFYGYDSGERGLGAFHRISAHKVGNPPYVPGVKPGGLPQITAG